MTKAVCECPTARQKPALTAECASVKATRRWDGVRQLLGALDGGLIHHDAAAERGGRGLGGEAGERPRGAAGGRQRGDEVLADVGEEFDCVTR